MDHANITHRFTPQNLATSLGALAMFNYPYCRGFENLWIEAAIPMLNQFNTVSLTNSIAALAVLKHHNQTFENAWIEAATPMLNQFTPQDLKNSMMALALLNHRDQDFEKAVAARLNDKGETVNDHRISHTVETDGDLLFYQRDNADVAAEDAIVLT